MILFTLLAIAAIIALIILIIGGGAFILVFGDVIVCIALLAVIIKNIIRKRS